jgi:two-component system copper resistance phosphate regulon response regulator CusR
MRILVIEDEEKLAGIISRGFKAEGFAVDIAGDGSRGLQMASGHNYDVIILDIMLPKLTGTEVLSLIREKNNQVPIIMLTARDTVGDKVKHIDMGADDYLTKPFAFSELQVRVKALLRRAPAQRLDSIVIADLEMDRLGRQIKRAGKRIDLSAKEYALLEYLMLNAGRVLSRNMIIEHVWDESFEGLTNIVDVYIRQLRNKVDGGYEHKLIKTVRGAGYVLNDEAA